MIVTLLSVSDYRAELYTRLVIEESRKQARKLRVKRNQTAPKAQQREVRGLIARKYIRREPYSRGKDCRET